MTRKEKRQEAEKKARKAGEPIKIPSIAELRAEDQEQEPQIILTVRDASGAVMRRITGPRDKGFQRVAWDLRYPSTTPVMLKPPEDRPPWWEPPAGPLALPGTYSVALDQEVDGALTHLAGPENFDVVPLVLATLPAKDRAAVLAFCDKVARLQRAVQGALKVADETQNRIAYLRKAVLETPDADPVLLGALHDAQQRLDGLLTKLRGDQTRRKRDEPSMPSINERVEGIVGSQWNTTSAPTQTAHDAYRYAGGEFTGVLAELRQLIEQDVAGIEQKLEAAGAPWTPGRIPTWKPE